MIIIGLIFLAILQNEMFLYIGAIFYGLGFGTIQPALQASAINTTPPEKRGMANATFFSAFDLGVGLGAMTFGLVAEFIGYSSIYWISATSATLALGLYFILRLNNKFTS